MIPPTCPVCDAPLGAPVEHRGRHALLPCVACGLQAWHPPEAADAAWYDGSDHYLAMSVVDWLGWYHSWGLAHVPPSARDLLDIGCADGRFVYAAAARGIAAYGIDHSERLVREGNARYGGSRLSPLSIEQLQAMRRSYDVVTLFEIIEHVPRPLALLEEARALLRPGGTLIVSTPNRLGVPRVPAALDSPPHHLTRWTPHSLRTALGRASFGDVELALSPPEIGIQEFVLTHTQLGIVRAILRRRASGGAATRGANRDVRLAIRAKEVLARSVARVLAPFIARFLTGAHMVARAIRMG